MTDSAPKSPVKTDTDQPAEWRPFETLKREIDRLFDSFQVGPRRSPFGRSVFDLEPFWGQMTRGTAPAVDVVESENSYRISAELPGMDEKDIEVKLAEGVLSIKGEKKEEKEERAKDRYLSERRYGSFQRTFRVPDGVDTDKITAEFKNGVLTVSLPKAVEAIKNEKTIPVGKA
jgi:HSP20 family protein